MLLERIKLVPKNEYEDKINEAKEIAKSFDHKDYPFVALSLKLNAPIWTGDKETIRYSFKSGKFLALDTQAVEELAKVKKLAEVLEDLKKRYLNSSSK
ncbi:MAG: hypothetical protein PWR13_540 [Archaeoglobi archaeon]|nr:hypothetical protein [Archaeoglobi archaeon]